LSLSMHTDFKRVAEQTRSTDVYTGAAIRFFVLYSNHCSPPLWAWHLGCRLSSMAGQGKGLGETSMVISPQ
jgi:hypothetical protein